MIEKALRSSISSIDRLHPTTQYMRDAQRRHLLMAGMAGDEKDVIGFALVAQDLGKIWVEISRYVRGK